MCDNHQIQIREEMSEILPFKMKRDLYEVFSPSIWASISWD